MRRVGAAEEVAEDGPGGGDTSARLNITLDMGVRIYGSKYKTLTFP